MRAVVTVSVITGLAAAAAGVACPRAGPNRSSTAWCSSASLRDGRCCWRCQRASPTIRRSGPPFPPPSWVSAAPRCCSSPPAAPRMDALGWVWPPALLGLLVWITTRIRRQLPRRGGRWMLYPVIAVTALAAVGGGVHTVTQAVDQATAQSPAGQLIDVGDHRLFLSCSGSGEPTVDPGTRPRGNLRGLGIDRTRRRGTHPGLRVRPGRPRPQRTRTDSAGRRPDRHRPAHPAGTGGRHRAAGHGRTFPGRAVRAGLHGPLPRAGRRDGAAGRHPTHCIHLTTGLPRFLRHLPHRNRCVPRAGPPRGHPTDLLREPPRLPGTGPGPGTQRPHRPPGRPAANATSSRWSRRSWPRPAP